MERLTILLCCVDMMCIACVAVSSGLEWGVLWDAKVAGRYIASGRTVQPAKQALDDDAAARLWDASCQLTGTTTHATLQ